MTGDSGAITAACIDARDEVGDPRRLGDRAARVGADHDGLRS
jgi:hypothetical protein